MCIGLHFLPSAVAAIQPPKLNPKTQKALPHPFREGHRSGIIHTTYKYVFLSPFTSKSIVIKDGVIENGIVLGELD